MTSENNKKIQKFNDKKKFELNKMTINQPVMVDRDSGLQTSLEMILLESLEKI